MRCAMKQEADTAQNGTANKNGMKYRAIGENHLYQKTYARGMKAVTKTVVVYCLRDYAAAKQYAEKIGSLKKQKP